MKAMMKVHQSAATTEQKVKEFLEERNQPRILIQLARGRSRMPPFIISCGGFLLIFMDSIPFPSPTFSLLFISRVLLCVLPSWKTWPDWKNLQMFQQLLWNVFSSFSLSLICQDIKNISVKNYMILLGNLQEQLQKAWQSAHALLLPPKLPQLMHKS